MYRIVRSDSEIDECLNKAMEALDTGSKWPGMSYEEGVEAAIKWLTEEQSLNPMEDD